MQIFLLIYIINSTYENENGRFKFNILLFGGRVLFKFVSHQ